MRRPWLRINRWLTWFHRWAGVALCLVVAMWFASGVVLHFVGFPALPPDVRRAHGEALEVAAVRLVPGAALERLQAAGQDVPAELRLTSADGRPWYVARPAGGSYRAVAADSGEPIGITPAAARRVAARFGGAPALSVSAPLDYDQWIVHQRFDPYRPLYRVRLQDAQATDLYVSARTGEVVQRTRARERAWNWAGAVMHWIYFTPLRKSWSAWNQAVWWLSLAALLSSAAGVWLGVLRTVSNRAAGRKGLTPFRGWMRWHHLIGLCASAIVVGWLLSGWLSMDHGRLFSHGEASAPDARALRGLGLAQIARAATLPAIAQVAPASSIEFNAVAGRPFLTAYGPGSRPPRVLFLDRDATAPVDAVPDALLAAAVSEVWHGATAETVPSADDALYRLAESAAGTAPAFVAKNTRAYVDRYSGRFVAVMDPSRRRYAWIYYALHTLQFPPLIGHPAARTSLVLAFAAVGFVFSITGVILSVARLRKYLGVV